MQRIYLPMPLSSMIRVKSLVSSQVLGGIAVSKGFARYARPRIDPAVPR